MKKIKRKYLILTLIFFLSIFFTACSGKNEEKFLSIGEKEVFLGPVENPEFIHVRKYSGDLQVLFLGNGGEDLVVRYFNQKNQPAKNVEINFTQLKGKRYGSGEVKLSSTSATTDSDGFASVKIVNATKTGGVTIYAEPADHSFHGVYFHLTVFPPRDSQHIPFTIAHYNDLHTHVKPWGGKRYPRGGLSRLAYLIKLIRDDRDSKNIPLLIANAGDDYEDTMIHDTTNGLRDQYIIEDRMGVDAYQVGNHEFHFGVPQLTDLLLDSYSHFVTGEKGHKMYIFWGNVDPTTLYEPYKDYEKYFEINFNNKVNNSFLYNQTLIYERNGLRFGLLGVVTNNAVYTQVAGDPQLFKLLNSRNPYAEGMTFFYPDPRDSDYISNGIDDLDSNGADVIVVISHTGLGLIDRPNIPPGQDYNIAKYGIGNNSGRGVDIILSAHTHNRVNHPILIDNPSGRKTYIIQGEMGGLYLSKLDFVYNTTNSTLTLIDGRLLQVDSSVPEDPEIKYYTDALIQRMNVEFDNPGETPLVYNPYFMSSKVDAPSSLGKLVGKGFIYALNQWGYNIDEAVSVPSLYRIDLWKGWVTVEDAYNILPLHNLVDNPHVFETLSYAELTPGIMKEIDFPLYSDGKMENVTTLEYLINLAYSANDIISSIIPEGAKELSAGIVQFNNISFKVDLSAKPMRRLVPGSIMINGKNFNPNKAVRIAGQTTLLSTVAKLLTITKVIDKNGNEVSFLKKNEETGDYFFDTGIPMWIALKKYFEYLGKKYYSIPHKLIDITGENDVRTIQPDLTYNASDITITPEKIKPGDTVDIKVKIRNLGDIPVKSAKVEFYYDSTPWLTVDNPDGVDTYEGFPADDMGSLMKIGEKTISVGSYPSTKNMEIQWDTPEDLTNYDYPIHIFISDVQTDEKDLNTGENYKEAYTANNGSLYGRYTYGVVTVEK